MGRMNTKDAVQGSCLLVKPESQTLQLSGTHPGDRREAGTAGWLLEESLCVQVHQSSSWWSQTPGALLPVLRKSWPCLCAASITSGMQTCCGKEPISELLAELHARCEEPALWHR